MTSPTTPISGHEILEHTYLDVVAFEARVRSSLGAELATFVSEERLEAFSSRFIELIGETSSESQLAYLRLVNEVLTEVGRAFTVRDLHVLWPSTGNAKEESAFLTKQGCHCLADIAQQASRRPSRAGPLRPNKFKL